MAAVRVSFTEVGVEEFNACFPGRAGPDFVNEVVLLMGADKQRGGKSIEVPFAGNPGGSGETHPEAVPAAFVFMADHLAEVIDDFISFADSQGSFQLSCQCFHRLQTLLVFRIRVDIRVVPEGTDIIPLFPPVIDGVGGTMGAAYVNQQLFHSDHNCKQSERRIAKPAI